MTSRAEHEGNQQEGSAKLDRHVAGSTQRWTFTDGPTKGKTYEHTFAKDGTVTFRDVEEGAGKQEPGGGERPRYGVAHIAEGIHAVSYLASSGYTLTVVLSEQDGKLHGFASNDEQWFQVSGTFERVD